VLVLVLVLFELAGHGSLDALRLQKRSAMALHKPPSLASARSPRTSCMTTANTANSPNEQSIATLFAKSLRPRHGGANDGRSSSIPILGKSCNVRER
jgi:hypothetical protein